MSFSFNASLTTDLDWIRAELGDTDSAMAVLSDEQIAAVLTAESNVRYPALLCCAAQSVALIAKEPVKVDAAGAVYDFSQRLTALTPLATAWRATLANRAGGDGTQTRQPTTNVTAKAAW